MFALTQIKGVGRRYSNLVCKKADVDLNKRAGELTVEELERVVTIMQNPQQYKIPDWFLNRQRDIIDGKTSQVLANQCDTKMREDLERLKKIRAHRGLRHYWGLRVRGQYVPNIKLRTHLLIALDTPRRLDVVERLLEYRKRSKFSSHEAQRLYPSIKAFTELIATLYATCFDSQSAVHTQKN